MILIADSGGTKIDWRLLQKDGTIHQANSTGFNPNYHPADDFRKSVQQSVVPLVNEKVMKIFFYGSGVSTEKNQKIIHDILSEFFPGAHIEIAWDLLASARALCGHEPGIACILGTGSNSCYYDGNQIAATVTNLGWILADEGSGTHLGKQLIVDYFRGKMPATLAEQFNARFSYRLEDVLDQVYRGERASAFLAGFTKFIFQHLKEPYCYQLVYRSFIQFYENTVMEYENHKSLKIHFTGSVAFYFSDVLRQAANDKGLTVKNILESPIAGLTLYHQKDLA